MNRILVKCQYFQVYTGAEFLFHDILVERFGGVFNFFMGFLENIAYNIYISTVVALKFVGSSSSETISGPLTHMSQHHDQDLEQRVYRQQLHRLKIDSRFTVSTSDCKVQSKFIKLNHSVPS